MTKQAAGKAAPAANNVAHTAGVATQAAKTKEALVAAGIATKEQEPMSRHTTFKIGGPAALFCTPKSGPQLAAAIKAARQNGLPHYFLGKGSNVLFCDEGYPGLIIHIGSAFSGISAGRGGEVRAGAGATLAEVCKAAAKAGLSGLEFAYGIPGNVGGAVYMNAGAYGGEVVQVLQRVDFLDENGETRSLPAAELGLGYRTSVFQHGRWCILAAVFQLQPGDTAGIQAQMDDFMVRRQDKQPLELPSAGSAFKRPPGAFAGALIDKCGLRGFRIGDAAISEKHCGFIVNLGKATCADVVRLADHVTQTVKEKTGYELEKEIRVVGGTC